MPDHAITLFEVRNASSLKLDYRLVAIEGFLGAAFDFGFAFSPPGDVFAADSEVDAFEHGDAPAAAGAGGEAFGNLRSDLRLVDVAEGLDFSERNMKAEADGVIGLQRHICIIAAATDPVHGWVVGAGEMTSC